ncbi:WD40-repeat-containing domain protein, partial [Blyttiomyces helicus]
MLQYLATAAALVCAVLFYLRRTALSVANAAIPPPLPDPTPSPAQPPKKSKPPSHKPHPVPKPRAGAEKKPDHPRLLVQLKGHAEEITGISWGRGGTVLASASKDRSVRLWSIDAAKPTSPKYIKVPIDSDYPTCVALSTDATRIVIGTGYGQTVRVYDLDKKTPQTYTQTAEFERGHHTADLLASLLSPTGKYVVSCSVDTTLNVWTEEGELVQSVRTNAVNNYTVKVSPKGRFFALGAFTTDVKIWEPKLDKSTQKVTSIPRAMDLTGHRRGITGLDFSADERRVATVSRDGFLRLFDIDVRYTVNEDPRILHTVPAPAGLDGAMELLALAPDARRVVVVAGRGFVVWDWEAAQEVEVVESAHGGGDFDVLWG